MVWHSALRANVLSQMNRHQLHWRSLARPALAWMWKFPTSVVRWIHWSFLHWKKWIWFSSWWWAQPWWLTSYLHVSCFARFIGDDETQQRYTFRLLWLLWLHGEHREDLNLYSDIKILLCIQGSKKTQGQRVQDWVQLMNLAQASLMSFFSLTPKNHPSKDLSGQTNQWQKVCSIMGHVTIWILFFDLSWSHLPA